MNEQKNNHLILAKSLEEAITSLKNMRSKAIPVAGATWIMRAPIRREKNDLTFVSLSDIKELKQIETTVSDVSIGCMATHEQISRALQDIQDLQGLRQAVRKSANPAIRNSATIGGNICTREFSASDLVPALLALNASVEIRSADRAFIQSMENFLFSDGLTDNANLLTRVIIPRSSNQSAHERLTQRRAGEYPVANLSMSVSINSAGKFEAARIAVGSVESKAKRWKSLEEALVGEEFITHVAKDIALQCLNEFTGRDATDAPGWYRVSVLPSLLGRAMDNLKTQTPGAGHHDR